MVSPAMKMSILRKFIAALSLSVAASSLLGSTSEHSFDAARLRTGRFDYRLMKPGKAIVGKFTVTVEKTTNGNFRFLGEAAGFNQKWESVATASFRAVSARLQMQLGNGTVYSMNLKYDDGHVTGTEQKESSPAGDIDNRVPPGTIDQRIDWAAAMSSGLEVGGKFNFTVFDPSTGVSQVTAEIASAGKITVPAGTFDAVRIIYQIDKSKGSERYEVLATKDLPRMMVREDFPNGISSELVDIQ
jgi:hypothetical protein